MSEPLVMALGITIVGMTLLFLTLLLFYGLLSLLTIVFKAPAPTSGEGVGSLSGYPQLLREVTREEVAAAARKYVRPEALVLAAAGSLDGA